MHVAPDDLRTVRQDGIVLRFATFGAMAFVLAEIPPSGTRETFVEQPCERPHWGFVIDGEVTHVADSDRMAIPAGHGFHVPAGARHHFEADGPAVIAGFRPLDPGEEINVDRLVAEGFEQTPSAIGTLVVPPIPADPVKPGELRVESWRMSDYVLSRVRMGERFGYTSAWCDAPHWGMVTSGRLAIEWEGDVELLSEGDVFHCPPGPPGHRVEAADPVTFIDLTPITALDAGTRLVDWRRRALRAARSKPGGVAVAALG